MEGEQQLARDEALLRRLRHVEIRARGLTHQIFAGEYHSAFKGQGMAFSEVRAYQPGDDVRSIDWNVTARLGDPFVKIFEEERELTVMLVVDVSGSNDFGSQSRAKREAMTEVAALLAFSALQNNDKVGMILFSDHVERFIPPVKGRRHALRIIWELLSYSAQGSRTDIGGALHFLTGAIKKRCTAFLLSDMLDFGAHQPRFQPALEIAAQKHDLVALQVYDPREQALPCVGMVRFRDAESGQVRWLNTDRRRVRDGYANGWQVRQELIKRSFSRVGVDFEAISTTEDYVVPLAKLFKRRGR